MGEGEESASKSLKKIYLNYTFKLDRETMEVLHEREAVLQIHFKGPRDKHIVSPNLALSWYGSLQWAKLTTEFLQIMDAPAPKYG